MKGRLPAAATERVARSRRRVEPWRVEDGGGIVLSSIVTVTVISSSKLELFLDDVVKVYLLVVKDEK